MVSDRGHDSGSGIKETCTSGWKCTFLPPMAVGLFQLSKGIAETQIHARGGGFCVFVGVDVENAHDISAEDADVAHIQCEAEGGLHIEPLEECGVGIPVSLAEFTDEGVGIG